MLVFYLMLNSTVLSLCVLSDSDQIHILIASVDTSNAATRAHIGIQVEYSERKRGKQKIVMVI